MKLIRDENRDTVIKMGDRIGDLSKTMQGAYISLQGALVDILKTSAEHSAQTMLQWTDYHNSLRIADNRVSTATLERQTAITTRSGFWAHKFSPDLALRDAASTEVSQCDAEIARLTLLIEDGLANLLMIERSPPVSTPLAITLAPLSLDHSIDTKNNPTNTESLTTTSLRAVHPCSPVTSPPPPPPSRYLERMTPPASPTSSTGSSHPRWKSMNLPLRVLLLPPSQQRPRQLLPATL